MTRITDADLRHTVDIINKNLPGSRKLTIEWAYGQPRVYEVNADKPEHTGTVREVSPRLSKPEMDLWLDGFLEAIDFMQRPNYDDHNRPVE